MITSVARQRQRILVAGLHLIAIGVLALQTYVRTFPPTATAIPEPHAPEARWWGLWPVTYIPNSLFTLGAAAIVFLIAYFWWRDLTKPLATSALTPDGGYKPDPRRAGYVLTTLSAVMLVAFFAFPIVHSRWGDAYILAKTIAWPDPDLRLARSWQAPLDVFLHSSVWLLAQPYTDWQDAAPVYRLLSPLAGAIYLLALLTLGRNWHFAPGWLTYGLVATLGVLQLFFGYVENYSFAAAFVLVYLWLGIAFAQGKRRLWPAATALAVANALHPSTIALFLSLLCLAYFGLRDSDVAGNKRWRNIVIQIVVPMASVYALTWIIMESGNHGLIALFTNDRPGGGDPRWLVPLWETTTKWEHYTLFSWPHLRDFLNEQLLIAPVVLPSLFLVSAARLTQRRHRANRSEQDYGGVSAYSAPDRPVEQYLAIAFLAYLLFVWLWNPDYGGQRDWDLFSLVAIPETLLLVYALARTLSPWRYLAMGAVPLIAVQALHTTAWIYQNTLPWNWP